jgi:hypothetical protein
MGFFGRERPSRGRDPGVPSRSSRKLRLDRNSDADLHPSSRQARLLMAHHGGSRRSGLAAHSSRNMSRAARAEEKIRLLDGIGGPGGATYSPPEAARPSSLAKRARGAAPTVARVALLLALVAAVFVIAARPDIITAGRVLAADALARALAPRADAPVAPREAVPEATTPEATHPRPSRRRRRESRDEPRDGPLASFPERCVRLTADGVGLGAEMLSLVHAARHFRSAGKAVVWDYADGAATCGCGETIDEARDERKEHKVKDDEVSSDDAVLSARGAGAGFGASSRAAGFRKLLRASVEFGLDSSARASVGESTSASGTCAEEEDDNGWFSMFSSDSVYPPARERALVGAAERGGARGGAGPLGRKAGAPSPSSSSSSSSSCAVASASEVAAAVAAASRTSPSARSRLAAGSANVMCEEVSSTWRLAPAMRTAVDAAFEEIGGDATRTVAFHATRVTSDGLAYAPDAAKEVARVERMMRGGGGEGGAPREDDDEGESSAEEGESSAEEGESSVDDSVADTGAADVDLSAKELRAVERANRERAREEAETTRAASSARSRTAAYIRSAMKDLRGDAHEKKARAKKEDETTDEKTSGEGATLMETFSNWLRAREDGESASASASLARRRRLLRVITDDASGEGKAAATEAKASAALDAAEGILTPPESSIAAEDASLLHRVRERFAGFARALESREAEAAAAEARRVEKREHERAFDEALVAAKANVRARVASETVASLSGHDDDDEGDGAGDGDGAAGAWRCVVVGDDSELAAEIVSAIRDANLPCEVVNRVTERPRGAERGLATLSPAERCRLAVDDVVAAEVLSRAERSVVAAPSDIGRLAALLQQCREDRLDMTDWAGLGVHELSVSAERGLPRAAAAAE